MSRQILWHIPDGDRYLIADDSIDRANPDEFAWVRILDVNQGVLYPPLRFDSVYAHNPYLEPYEGEKEVDDLLSDQLEARGPPADQICPDEGDTDDNSGDPGVVNLESPTEVDWIREARERTGDTEGASDRDDQDDPGHE